MAAQIVIVEQRSDWKPLFPDVIVVSAKEYVSQQEYLKLKGIRIINLCRSYRYLSLGYYCSLLAEARRHKIIPSVRTITELGSKSIYGLNLEDLDSTIQQSFKGKTWGAENNTFTLNVLFGHDEDENYKELSEQLFDLFRCPIMKVEFKHQENWKISSIKPGFIHNISASQVPFFIKSFDAYSMKRWQIPKAKSFTRYSLALLYNPTEKLPPSNKRALAKFVNVGKKLGIEVDLIKKKDFSRLAEYDALFIRETTQIEHHTYRFSKRAENEGMVVIDDPDSIVRCTNKIYLAELLSANKIPIPKTKILKKGEVNDIKVLEAEIAYPVVLKIPDSAFSRGVHKVQTNDDLKKMTTQLFADSDIIIAQEFMYTDFDWRICILNKQPIFACQYFMSKHHWQIVKHSPSGNYTEGGFKTWPVDQVPQNVVDIAVKAANLVGDGLYGIDLKSTKKGIVVMEINDNPNIDAGVEDVHLGDELYRLILNEFIRRLDLPRVNDKINK